MDRIVADPKIMGGVPCIRGTRIPVATIAGLLAENVTVQQVLEHYPVTHRPGCAGPAGPTPPGRDQR